MDLADHVENTIIMNKINGSGKCQIYFDDKFSNTSGALLIRANNNKCDIKFIYYYLQFIKPQIEEICYSGSLQKKLHSDKLLDFEIPMPSIEYQQEIIKIMDDLNKRKR